MRKLTVADTVGERAAVQASGCSMECYRQFWTDFRALSRDEQLQQKWFDWLSGRVGGLPHCIHLHHPHFPHDL